MINILNWLFLLVTLVASFGQLLSRSWKWILGFLALQYLGVFWFVQITWPFSLAIVKLISGIIACLALASSQEGTTSFSKLETYWPQGRLFRSFAAGLVLLTTLGVSPQASYWLGINNLHGIWVSLVLMGLGLLQLGITAQPMRVIMALLTFLSGFEILYSFVEKSTLVAALLVLINIGLSLVGVYLLKPVNRERSR
jgi:hypothetical protein